jgi:glutamate-5-semialdehyde dehydrogenase
MRSGSRRWPRGSRRSPNSPIRSARSWPNGAAERLAIQRVRTPIGVIGVIFESRPERHRRCRRLCLKAGNAAILRGGSDSFRSSAAIHACLVEGLEDAGPAGRRDPARADPRPRRGGRDAERGLGGAIDLIVPRGGKSLVKRVQDEARVPVFAHLEGVCHVYVHSAADPTWRAPSWSTPRCAAPASAARPKPAGRPRRRRTASEAARRRADRGGLRGARRRRVRAADDRVMPASEDDWATGVSRRHHRRAGGRRPRRGHGPYRPLRLPAHRRDRHRGRRGGGTLPGEVDSAIVLHNASTQFADGGEFGFGAEIGIATGKLHARGPVGLEQLTTFKYQVRGRGQIRPDGQPDPESGAHRRAAHRAVRRILQPAPSRPSGGERERPEAARLDWVWWLVSPLNPLKDPSEISDFAERLAAARALVTHPRIVVSDLEKRLGTRTTAEMLDAMAPMLRRGRFVWIMGADSFAGLHQWNDWREIPARLPLAVLDRPGFAQAALTSPAARMLARWRIARPMPPACPAATAGLGVPAPAPPAGKLDRDPPLQAAASAPALSPRELSNGRPLNPAAKWRYAGHASKRTGFALNVPTKTTQSASRHRARRLGVLLHGDFNTADTDEAERCPRAHRRGRSPV